MRGILLCGFLLTFLSTSVAVAQSGNYRSRQSGSWADPATWERDADSNGSFEENPASVAPTAAGTAGVITIQNTHAVTVAADLSADQVNVQAGGSLLVNAGVLYSVADGSGNDLVINATGTLSVSGTLSKTSTAVITGTSASNTTFHSGSTYVHLNTTTEGALPIATWDANSTVEITGYTNGRTMVSPTWSQNFGHFVWNCPAQNSITNLNNLITSVQGDFRVEGTNGNVLQLTNANPVTINIGRDILISGNSRFYYATTGNLTLNVARDFIYNSTNTLGSFFVSFGTATANIGRHFSMNASGSTLYVGAGSPSNGLATFDITGNFTITAGTFLENGSSSQAVLNFNNSTSHTFTNTGTMNGTIDYLVGPNDELIIAATSYAGGINGTGVTSDFVVNGTLTVMSTDALGAIRNATTAGNVRTPLATRVFNAGATIQYAGDAQQFIGNGHPNAADVNLTINNASGVGLASGVNALTIQGTLNLDNGPLQIVSTSGTAKTLTISGNSIDNGGTISSSGPATDILVDGAGTIVELPFLAGFETVRNLTVNKSSGTATLTSSLIVSNLLSLTNGNFAFDDQVLTLNNSLTYGAGTLSPNASSTLVIAGPYATSVGTIAFPLSANTIGTLTINRPATTAATINSAVIIATALNLTRGGLSNTNGLTMGNNSTIVRTSTGSLTGTRPLVAGSDSYNVTYSGSTTTTGLELPLDSDAQALRDLTINGGPITLGQSIIINGSLNLNSNVLSVSSFTITMEGTNWNDNAGSITLNANPVVFNGANTIIGGTAIGAFRDIQVNNGAGVTFPATSLTISEDIVVVSGGTINPNGGTVLLNGTTLQTINANGAQLHNVTVNKPSGLDVTLISNLNVSGVLYVQSANSDFGSNGFLTLLSTSDAAGGTASIASLLNNTTVSGIVTAQRFWSAEGTINRYISSPVTNAPVSQLQDDFPVTGPFTGSSYSTCSPSPCLNDGFSLKYYNEPFNGTANKGYTGYPTVDATQTLAPGRGYLANMWENTTETWDVSGPINRGTIVFPITHTPSTPTPIPDADGWNLIGNPYPSSIVWNNGAGWTRNEIAPVASVPDVAAGVFRTTNYLIPNAGDLPNDIIASGQAFWVYANVPGASMSINEQAKTNSSGGFYRENTHVALHPVLAISLKQGAYADNSFLIIHPESTVGYDKDFDGFKMEGEEFAISITDDKKSKWVMYSLPSLEGQREFPLSVKTAGGKSYSISVESRDGFDLAGWYLVDLIENKSVDLSKQSSYSFKGNENNEGRFFLTQGNFSNAEKQSVSMYPNPTSTKVVIELPNREEAQIAVRSALGAVVASRAIINGESNVEMDVSGYEPGVYMVIVKSKQYNTVLKLIKK